MLLAGFGQLHLPTEMPAAAAQQLQWSGCTFNIIMVTAAALLVFISLTDILRTFPAALAGLSRAKENITLQHNMQTARTRNLVAWVLFIPLAILTDRYHLYSPAFMSGIACGWSLLVCAGVLLAYSGVRRFLYRIASGRIHGEEADAVRDMLYTMEIIATSVMLATTAVLVAFDAGDEVQRKVLLIEAATVTWVHLVRSMQILNIICRGFSTILYLCALEIAPIALLIISAVVF